jgi:AraC-like DNA-binding protein
MSHHPAFRPELCVGEPQWSPFVANVLRAGPIYAECHHTHPRTTYHRQQGVEIHLTVEGRAQFAVDNTVFHQMPRQGLVFRGGTPHQFVSDPEYRFQRNVICFVPERLPVAFPPGGLMALDWLGAGGCFPFWLTEADYSRVDELCRRLRLETQLQGHGAEEMGVALLVMILVILRRNPAEHQTAEEAPSFRCQRGDLVHLASVYVQSHLAEDLPLARVAVLFRVSPEHLTRSFRRHLGVSFHQHVLSQRVAAAKERLRQQPGESVTDIAFATGFQSSSNFNKVFKQHTSTTPTMFRGEGASA